MKVGWKMMKINIQKIKGNIGERESFHFVTSADDFIDSDDRSWVNGSIAVSGEVVNNGRVIELEGLIHLTANYECDRCLKSFSKQVEIPFTEDFKEELDNKDGGEVTYYQGDEIDIADLVRETIFLAKPLNTVCSEECRGLCLKCGIDLNISECTCDRSVIDPRLVALQQLLDKK